MKSTGSPTADQVVSNHKCCRLPIVKLLLTLKAFIMNTKLLLAATVAVSLAGGVAMADEVSSPLMRVDVAATSVNPVNSERNLLLQRSAEAGSLKAVVNPGSALTHAQVKSAVVAARANGTLLSTDAASYWIKSVPSTLTRADVKAGVANAIAHHALPQNDSDYVDANALGHMDRASSLM